MKLFRANGFQGYITKLTIHPNATITADEGAVIENPQYNL